MKIKINDTVKNTIDEKIFGNFIEHIENCISGGIFDKDNPLSGDNGIRLDVLEKCKELAPPILRFPGGTVMGIYHWQDHVGPVENRKNMRNIVWGGMLCHEFGTAEFVEYCRKIGAEPMICVNMPTGTPEEAANWVEYCNGTEDSYYANLRRSHGYDEPFNVKYWCIGNESYAKPDLGIQHDVNVYIRDAWEFTKYMKMTDPSIELVYVGCDEKWNRAVLDSLAPVCDYLSVHFYSGSGEQSFKMLDDFECGTLADTEKLLNEYNEKELSFSPWYRIPPRSHDIKIALDEWNIWNTAPNERSKYGLYQQYSWSDALWVADFLVMMINHSDNLGIANMAQMVNVIAPIMADREGSWKQTTFYPVKYFRHNCGAKLLECSFDHPAVKAAATESEGGEKVIFLVNHSAEVISCDFDYNLSSAITMTCEDKNAVNSLEKDNVFIEEIKLCGRSVELKPYSINIIKA